MERRRFLAGMVVGAVALLTPRQVMARPRDHSNGKGPPEGRGHNRNTQPDELLGSSTIVSSSGISAGGRIGAFGSLAIASLATMRSSNKTANSVLWSDIDVQWNNLLVSYDAA